MAVVHVERQRFTVDDYHRMAEAGILSPDDRVELIDGEIIRMSPLGSRHAACVARISHLLHRSIGDRAIIAAQSPLRLSTYFEPEPDVLVLRCRDDFYAARHPRPEDVLFLMEVSDSSLVLDRERKLPAYGTADVPEAWIIDLAAERIERHSQPGEGGFRLMIWAGRGESLPSTILPDVAFRVDEMLGPPSESGALGTEGRG